MGREHLTGYSLSWVPPQIVFEGGEAAREAAWNSDSVTYSAPYFTKEDKNIKKWLQINKRCVINIYRFYIVRNINNVQINVHFSAETVNRKWTFSDILWPGLRCKEDTIVQNSGDVMYRALQSVESIHQR